jgi:hypothetical protein
MANNMSGPVNSVLKYYDKNLIFEVKYLGNRTENERKDLNTQMNNYYIQYRIKSNSMPLLKVLEELKGDGFSKFYKELPFEGGKYFTSAINGVSSRQIHFILEPFSIEEAGLNFIIGFERAHDLEPQKLDTISIDSELGGKPNQNLNFRFYN